MKKRFVNLVREAKEILDDLLGISEAAKTADIPCSELIRLNRHEGMKQEEEEFLLQTHNGGA